MLELQKNDIDMKKKLQIVISNVTPIQLTDLTLSLLAISNQFESFLKDNKAVEKDSSACLLIKEVRSGSVIVELVSNFLPFVPLLWTGGSISEWVKYAQDTLKWLEGKNTSPQKEMSKKDLKDWNAIITPIAKDNGSTMSMTAMEGSTINNNFYFNSNDAKTAQERIEHELEKKDKQSTDYKSKQVMFWHQAQFKEGNPSGNKGIIESISEKPVKVIFENQEMKQAMFSGDSRYQCQWQDLAYVVDINIQRKKGKPVAYKIIKCYPEDTFDPSEED